MLRAEILAVELGDLCVGGRLQAHDAFFNRRLIANVILGIRAERALQQARREHGRFGLHLFHAGEAFGLHDLELGGGQQRLAQDLAQNLQHRRQGVALGLNRETHRAERTARVASPTPPAATAPTTAAAAGTERCREPVEFIADLLIAELLGAAQHQLTEETRRRFETLEVLLVAVAEGEC